MPQALSQKKCTNDFRHILGVIGGMGPEATFDFYKKVAALANAHEDQDHLRQIIDCNPHVPDRNKALKGLISSPAPILENMAKNLEKAGATVLAMPCNTAHAYADHIMSSVKIPFVNMIVETVRELRKSEFRRPGVLATDACLETNLYSKQFEKYDFQPVYPHDTDQQALMGTIYEIKAGMGNLNATEKVNSLIRKLSEKGADSVILACTELPLVIHGTDVPLFVISSTDALARAVLDKYHQL